MQNFGVIFDMDGTMVDNMMTHHRAWQRKLADLGLELSLEEVKEKIHGVNEEILERLFGDRLSPAARKQISYEKEAVYREVFLPELRLVEGLDVLLDQMAHAKIPMAIGTAAPAENVDFVLDHLQLRPYYQEVIHAGMVERGKPDPEVFHKAAAGLGLPAQRCVVFEDSITGAETALRAGSPCVVITTTHTQEEFSHFPHILGCFPDFKTITLDWIREKIITHSNFSSL